MPLANINGVDLFYDQTGAGEPLLFHHGYTGTHDSWAGIIESLQDRFQSTVMDCRGASDSAHPEDGYTIEQMANDVIGMADHLGLETFTYIGHSMGGVIGMQLGLEYANRLTKLVLVAPAPADGIDMPAEARAEYRKPWDNKDRETLIRLRFAGNARDFRVSSVEAQVDRILSVSQGHYDGCWDSLVNFNRGGELANIQTPTLVISGAADGLLTANLKDSQRLPNATLHVFSRVSHSLPREVPTAMARVIADFAEHGVVTAKTLAEQALSTSTP
jgi:pimeloyl-ACP methyl ester carboxylesterase